MKKFVYILASLIALTLVGCGESDTLTSTNDVQQVAPTEKLDGLPPVPTIPAD